VTRYGDAGPGTEGKRDDRLVELDGQQFTALNGGPLFKFNEAVSFVVHCESQDEVDELWDKLSEGGQKSQCGWLKDRFGPLLADRSDRPDRDDEGLRRFTDETGHGGDAPDDEAGHRETEAGLRRVVRHLQQSSLGQPNRARRRARLSAGQ
jgi:hypothetical protein